MKHKVIYSHSLNSVLNTPFGFKPISTKISDDFILGTKTNEFRFTADATPTRIDHIYDTYRLANWYKENGLLKKLKEQQFEDLFLKGESEIDEFTIEKLLKESSDYKKMSRLKFWTKHGL